MTIDICAGCGRSTWLAECCRGFAVVAATVHLARESASRKGAWHLICRASMRGDDFHVDETGMAEVNCSTCVAIIERELRAAGGVRG